MAPLLTLLLIAVPVVEIYLIVRVGHLIGALPTAVLLLGISVAGGMLLRREGSRAWRDVRRALDEGRLPDREVADGALVLLGGALLVTPGFLTDAVGLLLLLPVSRPLARRLLVLVALRRARRLATRSRPRGSGPVIDVTAERERPPAPDRLDP